MISEICVICEICGFFFFRRRAMRQHMERPGMTGITFASLAVIALLIAGQLLNTLHHLRIEPLPPPPAQPATAVEAEAGMALLLVRQAETATAATGGPCLADLAGGAGEAPRSLMMVDGTAGAAPATDAAAELPCAMGQ